MNLVEESLSVPIKEVTEAAREFIEAWERYFEVSPGSPSGKDLEDLVCKKLENLKNAVMWMTKEVEKGWR